ncbi:MAG: Ykof family thiamine-binding protein [Actinobacteria bacterium]|nr:Ykof family thiamine-binding protein [Actinomycetota bacterium]
MIAIQVSLYPVGQEDYVKTLNAFWDVLKQNNINYKITPLSTITWDEDEDMLYGTIFEAYRKARQSGPAVMVTTVTTGDKHRIDELLNFL